MAQKELLVNFWTKNFNFTDRELDVFETVKREEFITDALRSVAYADQPLPILRGKTISQPTTVMIMTHGLEIKQGDVIFEIGAGSGYQTALLASLTGSEGKVISTEVIPELVGYARQNLSEYINVEVHEADGSRGWEGLEFDKIIITAACKEIPPSLIKQLKVGGIIIGPVGTAQEQSMVKGVKNKLGGLDIDVLGSYIFSPLYGKYGFEI